MLKVFINSIQLFVDYFVSQIARKYKENFEERRKRKERVTT